MNRETYPASLSPLKGDISAGAAAKQVTVVGLRNIPLDTALPADQNILRYDATSNTWKPSQDTNSAIFVNGIPVSDDYVIYVNASPLVKVNGV